MTNFRHFWTVDYMDWLIREWLTSWMTTNHMFLEITDAFYISDCLERYLKLIWIMTCPEDFYIVFFRTSLCWSVSTVPSNLGGRGCWLEKCCPDRFAGSAKKKQCCFLPAFAMGCRKILFFWNCFWTRGSNSVVNGQEWALEHGAGLLIPKFLAQQSLVIPGES